MKNMSHLAFAVAAVAALSTFGVTVPAQAQTQQEREERRDARRKAAPVTRTGEVTTPRGEISRKIEADIDTENDRAYRARTITGPEGQSGTIVGEAARTENGVKTSQTVTDGDGDTAGRSITRSAEDGVASRQREAYTRSGETATASDTVTRTDTGATRTQQFETSTGRAGAVNSDVARTDDGASYSRTATDADGNTVGTRQTTITNDESGVNKTTTVTDADGEVYESSREIKKN